MKKFYPSKASFNLIEMLGFILFIFILSLCMAFISKFQLLYHIIIAVVTVLYVMIFFVYFPLFFKKIVYYVSDTEIIKISGFFVNTKTLIKISSVQYMTCIGLPFSKIFMTDIIIFNALGSSACFYFLSKKDVEDIYKHVSEKIRLEKKRGNPNA